MRTLLLIGLLGGCGSMLRHALGRLAAAYLPAGFPSGTVLINVLGSFGIGLASMAPVSNEARVALMVGLLGGFTTFSAFSLESVELIKSGLAGSALLYIASSVVCCMIACWLGQALLS